MKFLAVILVVAGAALLLRGADDRAVPGLPPSVKDVRATEFTSEQYFEAPNEQQIKLRLSGASAINLPGGLQEIKQVRIEMFFTNGLTRAVAETPKCELQLDGVASSAGRLVLRSGDGKIRIEGDGFLWRQDPVALTISNNVHTGVKLGTNSLFKL